MIIITDIEESLYVVDAKLAVLNVLIRFIVIFVTVDIQDNLMDNVLVIPVILHKALKITTQTPSNIIVEEVEVEEVEMGEVAMEVMVVLIMVVAGLNTITTDTVETVLGVAIDVYVKIRVLLYVKEIRQTVETEVIALVLDIYIILIPKDVNVIVD